MKKENNFNIPLRGVIVYEILPDGCLNGVYSNDHPCTKNKIFNEIAKKKRNADDKVEGEYYCCYMDDKEPYMRDLKITNNNGQYELTWYISGTTDKVFNGIGWRTRENQLTVSYWD